MEMTIEQKRALAIATARLRAQEEQPQEEKSWGDVAISAAKNIVPSTAKLFQGAAEAVLSPVETAKSIANIFTGTVQNMLPESMQAQSAEEQRNMANAVGKFYAERYGSVEGFKEALATDPAGVLADATTVLSGGAGVISKVPGMAGVSKSLMSASRAVDPMLQTIRGAEKVLPAVGKNVAALIGNVGTKTGTESITQAAKAGFEGGEKAKEFASSMRGNVPMKDILDDANQALLSLKQKRAAEYRQGMQGIASDPQVLNFAPIENATTTALNIRKYKGKSISPTTTGIQEKIVSVIDDWKNSDPKEFHTAEGLDALKQAIGDIRDSTQYGSPERLVADNVYNSIKRQITQQAPEYAKIMKDYSQASELISEIQRSLLGKDKGSADTAIRKLQSIMSTSNKGTRAEMAKALEDAGAKNLLSNLAGQSLQDWIPHSRLGLGIGGAAAAVGNPLIGAGYVGMQSPRLMGEMAFKTGQGAGLLSGAIQGGRKMVGGAVGQMPYDVYLSQMDRLRDIAEEEQQ